MAESIQQGHTYAIGLGASAVGVGSPIDRALAAQGFAVPDAYRSAAYAASGWSPVVIYEGRDAPVKGPRVSPFVALVGRSGAGFQLRGYPGEISPLSVLSTDVQWVIDLGVAQAQQAAGYGFAGDVAPLGDAPAPMAPSATQTAAHVTGAGLVGWGVGAIGGAYAGSRSTAHPIAWGVVGFLLGGWVGGAIGRGVGGVAA